MIEDDDIANALGQKLLELDPQLVVGWPNRDVDPGEPHPYLIFEHVPVDREDTTLTGGGEIATGYVQVTIMSEIGLFTTAETVRNKNGELVQSAGAIAKAIRALFKYTTRIPVTGGDVTINKPPEVMQGYPDGPHWRTPVKINYSTS